MDAKNKDAVLGSIFAFFVTVFVLVAVLLGGLHWFPKNAVSIQEFFEVGCATAACFFAWFLYRDAHKE